MIGKSIEPWYILHTAIFAWHRVLSDRPPVLWWLSPREGRDAVTWCGWDNCKKGATTENQGSGVKYIKAILIIVCVCYLTWHDYPSLVGEESHGILLSMIHNIKVRILPLISCAVHPIPSNLSLFNNWRNGNIGRLVTVTPWNLWPRPACVLTHDRLHSLKNLISIGQKMWPHMR